MNPEQERTLDHDRLLTYYIEELTDHEIIELEQDAYKKLQEVQDILIIAKAEMRRRTEGKTPEWHGGQPM